MFPKKRVNRMSYSASLRRSIFLYHLEHQMLQIYSWLHSTFKEISNDTSHTQIQVQMKKLCHQQVGEENKSLSRFCRDRANDKAFLQKNPYFVATELVTNSVSTKPDFFATKVATNFVATKPYFVTTEPVTRLSYNKTQILS